MDLTKIQEDESLRQQEFPVTRERIYLAHAAVCPLPRRVADAIAQTAAAGTSDDQEVAFRSGFVESTRVAAANLVGAQPDEVAFVGPTSMGLSTVASGLEFRRGDNVVLYFDDYPSNVYPWLALAERGVETRLLNASELGRIRTVDVMDQVDENTRLVALASCHFISGFRIEVEEVGRFLRERGVLFCLDAIQTLGAFPTLTEHVDFLAADAHKWLLGPTAAGLLYVRRSVQDRLRPWGFGWHNVRCPDFVAQEAMVLRTDARRYELGSQNLLGLAGLRAALDLAREVGVDAIARDLAGKRARLVEELLDQGAEVLQPKPAPEHTSGIVSFRPRREDVRVVHERLAAGGVTSSLRVDRAGHRWIRFSPHYYNTESELEAALRLTAA
jgi:selenocysteine lyase/cysteine desulfurase